MFIQIGDLIRKIEEWIARHENHEYVNTNLDPVLLVPGIGGSILNAVYEDGVKERIWVRLFAADAEFRSKLYSRFDPKTGKTVSLNDKIKIEIPDDRHGLYSCDILDPDVIIRMNTVYYFHDLIEKMLSWGYEEGSTLFGFGYDFRQSNRHPDLLELVFRLPEVMEALKVKLETMHKLSGGKKVNIVSHSMGGLLVKSFLALHEEFFRKHVNTWIAIAAPFQGAPAFVTDCLLTGVEFVKGWQRELFVAKWSTHQLLIECPSIYELMAAPDFKWTRSPHLHVWHKKVNANGEDSVALESFGTDHCVDIMMEALKDNVLDFNGTKIPCPFNRDILEWASRTREIMKSARIPEGVKFYNIYGTSFETPFDVCYGSQDCPVENLNEILVTEANFVCVDGDGTVPVESSKADLLHAVARVGIPGDHRGILLEDRLFRLLKHWLKAGDPDPFYDPLNDYVIIPTMAEYEEYKKTHVKIHPEHVHKDQEQQEYIAAVISGSNGRTDARAEAHATVNVHDSTQEQGEDDYIEVSTFGVVEGRDAGQRAQALDEAMVTASEKAIAANADGVTCP